MAFLKNEGMYLEGQEQMMKINRWVLFILLFLFGFCSHNAFSEDYSLMFNTIDVKENKILIAGDTNLPDGVLLNLSLVFHEQVLEMSVSLVDKGEFRDSFQRDFFPGEYTLEILLSPEFQTDSEVITFLKKIFGKSDGNIISDGEIRFEQAGSNTRVYFQKTFQIGTVEEAQRFLDEREKNLTQAIHAGIEKSVESYTALCKLYARCHVLKEFGEEKRHDKEWEREILKWRRDFSEIKNIVFSIKGTTVSQKQKELELIMISRVFFGLFKLGETYEKKITVYDIADDLEQKEIDHLTGIFSSMFIQGVNEMLKQIDDPELTAEVQFSLKKSTVESKQMMTDRNRIQEILSEKNEYSEKKETFVR